jgi:hypothetical protein
VETARLKWRLPAQVETAWLKWRLPVDNPWLEVGEFLCEKWKIKHLKRKIRVKILVSRSKSVLESEKN